MGWSCHLLGYSEPRVVEAVQQAVAAGGACCRCRTGWRWK